MSGFATARFAMAARLEAGNQTDSPTDVARPIFKRMSQALPLVSTRSDVDGASRPDVPDAGSQADIDRLRRFGEAGSYAAGEHIVKAGDVAPGLIVVLSGRVEITAGRRARPARDHRHARAGQFHRASWRSCRPVRRWSMPRRSSRSRRWSSRSQRLRDLMVQEAELGERIMRALILRRVGLLESGDGGPDHHRAQRTAPTCCGCRVSSPATASRTACSIPTAIPAPRR